MENIRKFLMRAYIEKTRDARVHLEIVFSEDSYRFIHRTGGQQEPRTSEFLFKAATQVARQLSG